MVEEYIVYVFTSMMPQSSLILVTSGMGRRMFLVFFSKKGKTRLTILLSQLVDSCPLSSPLAFLLAPDKLCTNTHTHVQAFAERGAEVEQRKEREKV